MRLVRGRVAVARAADPERLCDCGARFLAPSADDFAVGFANSIRKRFEQFAGEAGGVLDEAKEQVEQLRVVLGALEARPAPRALLGDLNAPPAVVEPLLGEMGLRLTSTDPTAPAHRAVVQLDHIAVDGLHVISSETILTAVSDHLAVVVEAMPVEVDGL